MSKASLEALLGKEHADITYLKQDKIAKVLSKALSETYKHKPNDPVSFFSQYLLNHVKVTSLHDKVRSQNHNCFRTSKKRKKSRNVETLTSMLET